MEINYKPDESFNLMVIKILTNHWRRMNKHTENFNKERQNIKKEPIRVVEYSN